MAYKRENVVCGTKQSKPLYTIIILKFFFQHKL